MGLESSCVGRQGRVLLLDTLRIRVKVDRDRFLLREIRREFVAR